MKRLLAAVVLILAAAGVAFAARRYLPSRGASIAPIVRASAPAQAPKRIVPDSVRIRVEVINATKTRGLARRATLYLRDLGFDVVDFRTSKLQQDSSVVIDRTAHPEWAALASKALGGARVDTRPDSSRYLDLTILLGGTWKPPAQPFYP